MPEPTESQDAQNSQTPQPPQPPPAQAPELPAVPPEAQMSSFKGSMPGELKKGQTRLEE